MSPVVRGPWKKPNEEEHYCLGCGKVGSEFAELRDAPPQAPVVTKRWRICPPCAAKGWKFT